MLRVRFAPSPTGYLHIGSARTFIFNWLYARRNGGTMVLRLDDTDVERNTQTSIDSIFDGLKWLDLEWDEYYRQSDRLELHRKSAWEIFEKGLAYRDFTPALNDQDDKSRGDGPWLFNAEMRELTPQESDRRAQGGEPFVLRFRVPREADATVGFHDLVYGPQSKASNDIEDFALLRSNGMPTYHMASCADDADLKISHIIRGQDHLSNTFKHVLIFDALGVAAPQFAHLPLLIAPDGSKLSKRKHGPVVSVTTYRDAGFLPHSYVNFLCLLGWSPKDNREQMTREELVAAFSLEGVNRSNAVVNFSEADPIDPKALWLNSQHLRSVDPATLIEPVKAELAAKGLPNPFNDAELTHVIDVLRARYTTLLDFSSKGRVYFADDFTIEPAAAAKLDVPGARELMHELGTRLEASSEFTEASVEADLRKLAEERGVKAGVLINASRAALTGQAVGPSAFAVFICGSRPRDCPIEESIKMTILGLGGLMDDAAACLVRDGKVLAAVEQKKLMRTHREGTLPEAAITACLEIASVAPETVEIVAVARPFTSGTDFHLRVRALFPNAQLMVVDHHMAHAASAFYPSGFSQATVLTFDRGGDFRCGAKWHAADGELKLDREFHFPDSIGDLYSRVTELLGYTPRADEHKVQWLATAGSDRFVPLFGEVFDRERMRIHPAYTDTQRSRQGLWSAKLFAGLGLADGDTPNDAMKVDIAFAVQRIVEQTVLEIAGGGENLCVAGGLFFNALLVAALERSGDFRNVYVQPAAGNAGTALGAAFVAGRVPVDLGNLCLGPEYSLQENKKVVENCKLSFQYLLTTDELISHAVELLDEHKIVAWMQGRMEFGPRALGNRSILASPLDEYSTENLNVFIKHREPYRKFAASVPAELASEYFDVGPNARFLATVGRVKEQHRSTFRGAILGSDLVRVHTVTKEDNPLYHRLLHAAGAATGLPVLYNTSFNLFGDPLVCTPRDAVRSFYSSGIDALFVGNFLMQK